MPRPHRKTTQEVFEPVYPITDVPFPPGFLANLRKSIARNEKAIVARQLQVLHDAVASQPRPLGRMDASVLFEAACHKRGGGVSRLLVDAGIRAHTSKAMKWALERGHLDVFRSQVHSIDTHEPLKGLYAAKSQQTHLLSLTMLKGLADPLNTLLDKPVSVSEGQTASLLADFQIAEFLLSVACSTPPPHKAIDVLDVLLDRGADPRNYRIGMGDQWFSPLGDRPWIANAFHNGNLDLGVALARHCASRNMSEWDRTNLGHKCGCAILAHAKSLSGGPAQLAEHHRKAMQSLDALGFPMPPAHIDEAGVWTYKAGIGDYRQLQTETGQWLQALSARGHMDMETDPSQVASQRAPRF